MADDYYGDDINDDYFDDNENNYSQQVCHVYDAEDSFTSFVQIMLAVLSLASLHVKRNQEVPRRKFETWFLDVSKQGVGAVYAHFLNMAIAKIIAQNVRGDITLDDECAWYAINYLIDTTIGLVLSIMFLQLLDIVADQLDWAHLKNKGVYVGKDRYTTWAVQLVVWIIILTIVKLLICWFMWLTSEWLAWFGKVLFEPFQKNIRFELLFVMIFFPGILNVIYFWIIDSYLKASKEHLEAHEDFSFECCKIPDNEEPILQQEYDEIQNYVHMDKTKQEYMQPTLPCKQ